MQGLIEICRILLIHLGIGSIFLVVKLIKPPKQMLFSALTFCWLAGLLNLIVDFFEQHFGFWHYTLDGLIFSFPLDLYIAVSFFIGGSLCLIYWWVYSFHKKWLALFLIVLPFYFLLQDYVVISATGRKVIIFDNPYWWAADFVALSIILYGTLLAFNFNVFKQIRLTADASIPPPKTS